MKRSDLLEKKKKKQGEGIFINNPDVSLLSPHMWDTRRYEDKHATSTPLTLSSFLSQLNTNTNTHTADYTIQALTTALGR